MRRWRDPARVAQWCSGQFADRSDPFGYTEAAELDRFQCALRLLNGLGPFSSALEIGCAEGHFTALLARQCDDLRAADVSEIAIERARARCAGLRVHFIQLDAVEDPLPGSFDLVVIMDVLEMIYDRRVLKRMRDKIVSAVKPGGYLLVGNSRQNPTFETAWWGRWLLRGGKQINDFIGRAPGLTTLRTETSTLAINTLYRRNS